MGNEKENEKPRDYWSNKDNCIAEAKKAMAELEVDRLPGVDVLSKNGYSCLIVAINNYYGGFHEFRKLLGQKPTVTEQGAWKNIEYTIGEAMKIMKEMKVDELPTGRTLNQTGHSDLVEAITRYHGGFHAFRSRLN